ncbi:MAG: hypothetical protein ACP5P9_08195, partial [Acidimicrobiales bacterium]
DPALDDPALDDPALDDPANSGRTATGELHRRTWSVVVAGMVLGVAPFVAGLVIDVAHGWLPLGDDAVIADRSWLALGSHGPLLGQVTLATAHGHPTYDLGPLLYWLLAVPVHVDPVHGALWGAALWSTVAVAVTVVAAHRTAGPVGALVAGAVFPVLAAGIPLVALDPTWNPSIGLCWYVAAAAAGIATAAGNRWWFPVLVLAGSVAAQCHLSLAASLPLLLPVALVVGVAGERRGVRRAWLAPISAGLAVAVGCWAATVVQQLTGHPGNLTALATATGHGADLGWVGALHTLGTALGIPPLWWRQIERFTFHEFVAIYTTGSIPVAVAAEAAVAATAVFAWRTGRRALAAAAVVALTLSAAAVAVVAHFPLADILALGYTVRPAYVVGILTWVVLFWAVVVAVAALLRRARQARRHGRPVSAPSGPGARGRARERVAVTTVAGTLAAVGLVTVAVLAERSDASVPVQAETATQVRAVDAAIRPLASGPVVLHVAPDPSLPPGGLEQLALDFGVLWLAHTQGYSVRLPNVAANSIGPEAAPAAGIPSVTVTFAHGRPVASSTASASSAT